MKNSYPIVLMPDEVGYVVYIPDFDINTEGDTLTEAMEPRHTTAYWRAVRAWVLSTP